jgi:hypothetical protein
MPEIDILPAEVTPTATLGPITAEEGSIQGNYRVLEDIFLRQLSLDREKDFSDRLFSIYGDQLTVARLRSIQTERKEAELPSDHNWLVQVPSFFHVRMNLLYLINQSHYGDPDTCVNVYSALGTHAQVLNRAKIPKTNAPFEHLEDIAIHSFYVALFSKNYRHHAIFMTLRRLMVIFAHFTLTGFLPSLSISAIWPLLRISGNWLTISRRKLRVAKQRES